MRKKVIACFMCVFILSTILTIPVCAKEELTQTTVKVGFFSSEGYHDIDEEGHMSGYGYDFLQMLLRYNDWKYEYIGYDANWSDMMDMLDRGEIDIVTLADKTVEREQKYDYSSEPIGTSSTIITISDDTQDIEAGNYDTYEGKTVGLVKDSSHNVHFETYAKEKGFSYQTKYYNDVEELLDDLREHKNIDIAVTSNMRKVHDEVILDEFNRNPYYAMVRKGETAVLDGVNQAIGQLNVYSPNWQDSLFDQYYSNINSEAISLTPTERDYLLELSKDGKVIKAAMNPDLEPYSYFEDGEARGIVPVLFKKAADELGMKYEILYSGNRSEYKKQLTSGAADVDLTALLDFGIAAAYHLKETDEYLSSYLTAISKDGFDLNNSNLTVAMVNDPTEYAAYNQELIYNYKYKEYDSLEDCIKAVKKGEADVTYCYAYTADKIINEDYSNQLKATIMPEYSFGLALGIQENKDYRLLSTLNKSVQSLSNEYVSSVCLNELSQKQKDDSLKKMLYEHPILITCLIVLIAFLIIVIIVLFYRTKNRKNEIIANKKLNRFIKYSCENYDIVTEMDLENRIRTDYSIVDGQLEEKSYPYIPLGAEDYGKIAHPEDVEKILSISDETRIRHMFETNEQEDSYEVQIKDQTGQYRWYLYTIRTIEKDEQHPCNYMLFKRDIQMLKDQASKQEQILREALEAAKEANETKENFLSRISHELRTPLNVISGFVQEQEQNCESDDFSLEDEQHSIAAIQKAVRYQEFVVGELLDMQQIENGRIVIEKKPIDATEFIEQILELVCSESEQKHIDLTYERLTNTGETYCIDPLRSQQILFNILHNAIKFTPDGGRVKLTSEVTKQDGNQVILRLVVSDTGIGMSREFMDQHLFQDFTQENCGITSPYAGCGIGLAMCQKLVQLMGGTIACESEQGKGTKFIVEIPAEIEHKKRRRRTKEVIPCDLQGIHVLLCEDNDMNQEIEKKLLERMGCEVQVAENGRIGCERFKQSEIGWYDIVLMDIRMPEMDGLEATQMIRKMDRADAKEVPIIAVSANAYDEDVKKSLEAGMNEHLAKPMDYRLIHSMILEYCVPEI